MISLDTMMFMEKWNSIHDGCDESFGPDFEITGDSSVSKGQFYVFADRENNFVANVRFKGSFSSYCNPDSIVIKSDLGGSCSLKELNQSLQICQFVKGLDLKKITVEKTLAKVSEKTHEIKSVDSLEIYVKGYQIPSPQALSKSSLFCG